MSTYEIRSDIHVVQDLESTIRFQHITASNHVEYITVPRHFEPHGSIKDLAERLSHHDSRCLGLLSKRHNVRHKSALLEVPDCARRPETRLDLIENQRYIKLGAERA